MSWLSRNNIEQKNMQSNSNKSKRTRRNLSRWRKNHSRTGFLLLSYSSTKFATQRYYQNEQASLNFTVQDLLVFIQEIICIMTGLIAWRKDWGYVINFEYKLAGTHWIALYVNDNIVTYFDSFRVEHIPQESKNVIRSKT